MNIPEVDAYQDKVQREVTNFKQKAEAIEKSIDPRYRDETFKQAAIDELKAELDANVNNIQSEYKAFIDEIRHAAKEEAANKRVAISNTAREQAAHTARSLAAEIAMGDGQGAIDILAEKLPYMDDRTKLALSHELPSVMQAAAGKPALEKQLRSIYRDVRQRESAEEVFAKAAQKLPDACTLPYTTLKMANKRYFNTDIEVKHERRHKI
ncbi:hypothetical protein [Thalassobacillus devorans]|uniref:hypothetical protein n=1 Tax=Thalassobacillus devorans TaxID=279813 RepID=UPI00111BE133|nr:hypothetical protein [Thalassobacillus devorans]